MLHAALDRILLIHKLTVMLVCTVHEHCQMHLQKKAGLRTGPAHRRRHCARVGHQRPDPGLGVLKPKSLWSRWRVKARRHAEKQRQEFARVGGACEGAALAVEAHGRLHGA